MASKQAAWVFRQSRLESGTHPIRRPDRRDVGRVSVDVAARVEWGGRISDAILADLGVAGAFVRSSLAPPYGARVQILLEHGASVVHLHAVVRWADERGFGAQFDALGAFQTSVIIGFIARARAKSCE